MSNEARLRHLQEVDLVSSRTSTVQPGAEDVSQFAAFAYETDGEHQVHDVEHRQVIWSTVLPVDDAGHPRPIRRYADVAGTEVPVNAADDDPLPLQCPTQFSGKALDGSQLRGHGRMDVCQCFDSSHGVIDPPICQAAVDDDRALCASMEN